MKYHGNMKIRGGVKGSINCHSYVHENRLLYLYNPVKKLSNVAIASIESAYVIWTQSEMKDELTWFKRFDWTKLIEMYLYEY